MKDVIIENKTNFRLKLKPNLANTLNRYYTLTT